eukprot:145187_1
MWSVLKRTGKCKSHLSHMADAWSNCVTRLNAHPSCSTDWKQKFCANLYDYTNSVKLENQFNNGHMSMNSLSDYKSFRIHASGAVVCIRFIELLNKEVDSNHASMELEAGVVVGVDNDLMDRDNGTCNVLQLMDRSNAIKLRNNTMKTLNGVANNSSYTQQLLSFVEGLARWQIKAKQRYLSHDIPIQRNFYTIHKNEFYFPNHTNINWNDYCDENNTLFQKMTAESYEFAVKNRLFDDHPDFEKIWNSFQIGFFSYGYPFVDVSSSSNVQLLQLINDFIAWFLLIDDDLEFTDDHALFENVNELFSLLNN